MKLNCLAVCAAMWSVCAYTKGPEAPKQMIRNLCEPVHLNAASSANTHPHRNFPAKRPSIFAGCKIG